MLPGFNPQLAHSYLLLPAKAENATSGQGHTSCPLDQRRTSEINYRFRMLCLPTSQTPLGYLQVVQTEASTCFVPSPRHVRSPQQSSATHSPQSVRAGEDRAGSGTRPRSPPVSDPDDSPINHVWDLVEDADDGPSSDNAYSTDAAEVRFKTKHYSDP